jgi:hypothetical protein
MTTLELIEVAEGRWLAVDCCTAGDLEDAQQRRRGEPSRTHPPWRRDGSLPGVSRRLPTPGSARAPAGDSLERVLTPIRPCRSRPRAASRWLAADCCTAATIGSTFTGLPTGPAGPTHPCRLTPCRPTPAQEARRSSVARPVVLTLRDPGGAGQYRRRGIWSRARSRAGARRRLPARRAAGGRLHASEPSWRALRLTDTGPSPSIKRDVEPCKHRWWGVRSGVHPSGPPGYEERAIGGGAILAAPSTEDGFLPGRVPEGACRRALAQRGDP